MFTRRASKGQCVGKPYLAAVAADFRLVTADSAPATPIPDTRELGWMLHDLLDFSRPSKVRNALFHARMEQGVIEVPPFEEARG